MACLLSGEAGVGEATDEEYPAHNTLRLWEKDSGKDCAVFAHQASLWVLVSLDRVRVG